MVGAPGLQAQTSDPTFPVNGTQDKALVATVLEHATVHLDATTVVEDGTVILHRGRIVAASRCNVACSSTVATSALSWVPLTGKVGSVVWAWRLVTETKAIHAPTKLASNRLRKCRIRRSSIQNQVRRVPKKVMPRPVKVHRMVGATQAPVYLCP